MKNIKKFILVLCVALFCVSSVTAQKLSKRVSKLISKTNLSSQEIKPVEYSMKNYVLLKRIDGDISEYYVSELGIGIDSTNFEKKERLFSFHKDDHVKYMHFSCSGNQLAFRKVKNEKLVWEVHDIKTKKSRIIESNEGSVSSVSIYDINNILSLVSGCFLNLSL